MAMKNRESTRILLVYSYYHHHLMVERLASIMAGYGISMELLCTDNYKSTFRSPGLWLMRHAGRLGSTRLVHRFFERCVFPALARRFDLVDFHVFTSSRLPLMRACKDKGIPFDISPWGTDVLRSSREYLDEQAEGFGACRFIKSAPSVLDAVSEAYGGRYDAKMRTVYWGQMDFEVIDSIGPDALQKFRESLSLEDGDITVCCGYNAFLAQQHLAILKALGTLPDSLRQRIFLLIPMTYPPDPKYVEEVKSAAEKSGLRHVVFDRYMTAEDVAALRISTDVVVNMQITDAFSGSLQGHLYAGGVLVIGEWLNYPMLDGIGAYYIKTNFDTLASVLQDVLTDLPEYKRRCQGNREKISGLTSWPAVAPAWAETYKI